MSKLVFFALQVFRLMLVDVIRYTPAVAEVMTEFDDWNVIPLITRLLFDVPTHAFGKDDAFQRTIAPSPSITLFDGRASTDVISDDPGEKITFVADEFRAA